MTAYCAIAYERGTRREHCLIISAATERSAKMAARRWGKNYDVEKVTCYEIRRTGVTHAFSVKRDSLGYPTLIQSAEL